jgi:GNAT superfamily N-acetyltransferase
MARAVKRLRPGKPRLDEWLKRYAGQGERRDTSRTFVRVGQDGAVIGYYTLVVTEISRQQATEAVSAGTSTRFSIPACLIARLAVDQRHHGRGLGSFLLHDALARVLMAAEQVAIRAVVVDAIDHQAARFYTKFGFSSLADSPLRLQVPLTDVREVLGHV